MNARLSILNGVAQRLLEKEKIEGPEFEELYVNDGVLPAGSAFLTSSSDAASSASSDAVGDSASSSDAVATPASEASENAESDDTASETTATAPETTEEPTTGSAVPTEITDDTPKS